MVAACMTVEGLVRLLLVVHVTWDQERGHVHTSQLHNQA